MKKLLLLITIIVIIFVAFNFESIKDMILETLYPTKYSQYVEKYCKEYEVDKYLIYAMIKAESNFKEEVVSHKGANGIMQLMYPTAKEVARKLDLSINKDTVMEPKVNINLGTKYISLLIEKYDNVGLALAAYNAGKTNVDSWIKDGTIKKDGSNLENIPYKETNTYVRKILRNYKIYEYIYKR